MFCINCGTQVNENAAFCRRCGTKLSEPPKASVSDHPISASMHTQQTSNVHPTSTSANSQQPAYNHAPQSQTHTAVKSKKNNTIILVSCIVGFFILVALLSTLLPSGPILPRLSGSYEATSGIFDERKHTLKFSGFDVVYEYRGAIVQDTWNGTYTLDGNSLEMVFNGRTYQATYNRSSDSIRWTDAPANPIPADVTLSKP